jgi:hypothetical protein
VLSFVATLPATTLRRHGAGLNPSKPSPKDVLYRRGRPADALTLVLNGKLTVLAGVDGFRSEVFFSSYSSSSSCSLKRM